VKIDPQYEGAVVYVKDASRSVGVCQTLLTETSRGDFIARIKDEHAERREQHRGKRVKAPQFTLAQARANRHRIDWQAYQPPRPTALGITAFDDYPLAELTPYIDWMPFFNAWEFTGRFPDLLTDAKVGEAASNLYADARRLLRTVVAERWIKARAVLGFFAANSVDDDDIEVYADESRSRVIARLHHLRQQKGKPAGQSHDCLADFVAPKSSGVADYIGAFAVTAGFGLEPHVQRFQAAHDDYNAIMLKALADRYAEALAERLHERVRRELWGYAPDEELTNEKLIREEYRGIRPAPGYPACPEHTEKGTLWQLLDVERKAGIVLTESFAMFPTAAVSGFYFSHPNSRYFAVGQIDLDQVQSYARRKGMTLEEAQRWLAPNLGYDAEANANAA
jgi:5-methyltetrahydrofolate--homocysteine methyltransferase